MYILCVFYEACVIGMIVCVCVCAYVHRDERRAHGAKTPKQSRLFEAAATINSCDLNAAVAKRCNIDDATGERRLLSDACS